MKPVKTTNNLDNESLDTKQEPLKLKSILKNREKNQECELKNNEINPQKSKKAEIVRFFDDFEENKTEKDNPRNIVKRSKAFISGLSSLGEPELLTDKKSIAKIYYQVKSFVKTTYQNK